MGKRASLSLRFNFLCTEGLHSHSFEIMACCDVLGPAPSTDLRLHLYRQLYLCHDSEMAQLWALALLPYQVDFVKASVMRVKELIRLMVHWFRTSFANSTEENKYVASTWAPWELPRFRSLSFLYTSRPYLFPWQAQEREYTGRERESNVQNRNIYITLFQNNIMVWQEPENRNKHIQWHNQMDWRKERRHREKLRGTTSMFEWDVYCWSSSCSFCLGPVQSEAELSFREGGILTS